MWRWLHSLPRAVRQQFHSPGASAGICVEDIHENELSKHKRDVKIHRGWVYHCKCRNKRHGDNEDKTRSNAEDVEFWKLLHRRHSAFEAIGLSGAIALCVELTHFNSLGKFGRTEDKQGCLLRRLASSLHHFGGNTYCPVNRLHSGETSDESRSDHNASLQDLGTNERTPPEATDSGVFLSNPHPPTETFQYEQRFDIFDSTSKHQAKPQVTTESKTHSDNKQKADNKIQADTTPVLSIEEAFSEFESMCKTYTAVGKSIMGHQAALKGNMKSAAALWEEASSFGHSKSYFNLALCHEHGRGVKKDISEAIRVYKLAVEDNHPQAMYNLALILMDGNKQIPQDTKQAVTLLTRAAEFGLIEAQKYLGVYYSGGEEEDPAKAVHYMRMAAEQNDTEYQCFLVLFYEHGYGVENSCKAAYLYNNVTTCIMRDTESQCFLAMFYEHGYGVEENPCKAAYLYNKAAEGGNIDAMYSLALYHLDGLGGLPQDQHCARTLLQKSANLGNKQAQNKLDELERLSDVQFLTGEKFPHTVRKNKSSQDLSYLLRLNKSVSTPCLSELVRSSFKEVKDKILYDPVSNVGTVSQIYTQLMVPRGVSLVPSMTQIFDQSETCKDDTDSDSGIVFRADNEQNEIDDVREEYNYCVEMDNHDDYMNSQFIHSASMPDIMMITCM